MHIIAFLSHFVSLKDMVIIMNFNPSAFIDNLHYMGEGMLSIFIVIGVLVVSVVLLKSASGKK